MARITCKFTSPPLRPQTHNSRVGFQEEKKYGRQSGVELGGVDFVKFAEAFGAKGFRVTKATDLERVMKEAIAHVGVSVVDVPIDYSEVVELMANVIGKEYN